MFEAGPDLAEKVHRILDEKRVLTTVEMRDVVTRTRYAYVMGETQPHLVRANPDGVYCDCIAFQNGHRCAHQLAAMVLWAELLQIDEPFEVAV